MREYRLSRLSILPVAAIALAGFVGNAALAQNTETLVVNVATAPATLDPAWTCGTWENSFVRNFYTRLTKYGDKLNPDGTSTETNTDNMVPHFARTIDISDDGLVYTFILPAGYTFPSGHPMDAAAAKYSFERSINMGGCGSYFIYDGFYDPPLIKTIEAVSPTKLVITLNLVDKNALQDWAQTAASLVDKSVVDQHGGIQTGMNEWMTSHTAARVHSFWATTSLTSARYCKSIQTTTASARALIRSSTTGSTPIRRFCCRRGRATPISPSA